jgi:hypothetical protein
MFVSSWKPYVLNISAEDLKMNMGQTQMKQRPNGLKKGVLNGPRIFIVNDMNAVKFCERWCKGEEWAKQGLGASEGRRI